MLANYRGAVPRALDMLKWNVQDLSLRLSEVQHSVLIASESYKDIYVYTLICLVYTLVKEMS